MCSHHDPPCNSGHCRHCSPSLRFRGKPSAVPNTEYANVGVLLRAHHLPGAMPRCAPCRRKWCHCNLDTHSFSARRLLPPDAKYRGGQSPTKVPQRSQHQRRRQHHAAMHAVSAAHVRDVRNLYPDDFCDPKSFSPLAFAGLEKTKFVGFNTAQFLIVQDYAANASVFRQGTCLWLNLLGSEYTLHGG